MFYPLLKDFNVLKQQLAGTWVEDPSKVVKVLDSWSQVAMQMEKMNRFRSIEDLTMDELYYYAEIINAKVEKDLSRLKLLSELEDKRNTMTEDELQKAYTIFWETYEDKFAKTNEEKKKYMLERQTEIINKIIIDLTKDD